MSQDKRDRKNTDRASSSGDDDKRKVDGGTSPDPRTGQSKAGNDKPTGSSRPEQAGPSADTGDRSVASSGSSAGDNSGASHTAQPSETGESGDSSSARRGADAAASGKNHAGSEQPRHGQKKNGRASPGGSDQAQSTAASKQGASSAAASAAKTSASTTKSQARSASGGSSSNQSPGAATASTSGQRKTSSSTTDSRAGGAATTGGGRAGGSENGGGRSPGLVVAVVALIIAIVAAGSTGYLWYRGQQRIADLNSRVHTVEKGQQHTVQKVMLPKLSDMHDRMSQFSQRADKLSKALKQRKQQIGQLQQTIQHVQVQNRQLSDQLGGNHQRFVEQRIALLLEAANQRLQIDRDPRGAAQALSLADQAIQRSDDPELHPVRARIADEKAALKALPHPDIEGLSLKLSNAIQQVPKLPLKSNLPSSYHAPADNDAGGDNNGSGSDNGQDGSTGFLGVKLAKKWHQFVDSVGSALSHMVTIRRANGTENAPALMAPDQSYFLTQNLQLQLRAARLALLDGNGKTYDDALSEARDWIRKYFDTSDSRVSAVLDDLSELSHAQLDWQAPDLSASLKTLRGIMDRNNDTGGSGASAADNDASKHKAPDHATHGKGQDGKQGDETDTDAADSAGSS